MSGLEVTWDPDRAQIRVAPGLAVDPAGRLVCVSTEQCADLGGWLDHRREDLEALDETAGGVLPDAVELWVALCYRECETDTVPLPSATCRTGEESMAASRLLESFELRLLLAPPGVAGEVVGDALPQAVERLLALLDEDPPAEVDAVRRELVDWATRERPELPDDPCLCPPDDDCEHTEGPSTAVVLAHLNLGLDEAPDGRIVPVDPEVDDADRPILLSTRFLQECLTALLVRPHEVDHGNLDNLDVDGHPQYLLVDGSRAMTGSLDAGGNRLRQVGASSAGTDAMRRNEIVGGDLGAAGASGARIQGLQGAPVEASGATAPSAGDVLRYDGSRWTPAAPAGGGTAEPPAPRLIGPVLPLVTLHPVGREGGASIFMAWFHFEVPDAGVRIEPGESGEPLGYGSEFEIFVETCEDGPVLRRIASNRVSAKQVACNVFRIEINRQEAELLRVVWHLRAMRLSTGGSLAEFTEEQAVLWVGRDGDEGKATVTSFLVNPSLNRDLEGFEGVSAVRPADGGRVTVDRER